MKQSFAVQQMQSLRDATKAAAFEHKLSIRLNVTRAGNLGSLEGLLGKPADLHYI